MTTMYALIIDDRHSDTDVEIYADRDTAINKALDVAAEYGRHPEDVKILDIEGYEAYIQYSCESDHVAVLAREVKQ